MGQAAKELRETWRRRYTQLLDSVFDECASGEIMLEPDDAMAWMEELLERLVGDSQESRSDKGSSREAPCFRFDYDAYRREAHHYAVDRFYKTYYPGKRGAPPLPDQWFDRILPLMRKGMNYVAIAERLGQPKDKMRKQVEVAEKRWSSAVEGIERIKQRSPHLVVGTPPNINKLQTSRRQSKRQRTRARTGK